jgi:DNA modification methylase
MGIDQDHKVASLGPPKLILTSPPYPGVHVLYHRWQVQSRRETPAPYWIANCTDSYGESYYTFGNRKELKLPTYFKLLYLAFNSLAKIANSDTIVVQMVSFPEPSWQLPLFLNIMEKAGFSEITFPLWANSDDERIWRNIPNRKWYAKQKYSIHTSKEVVLFHKLD